MAESAQALSIDRQWQDQSRSLWGDAWHRFAGNRKALVGLFIVLFFAVLAVFGPMVAPYKPLAMQLDAGYKPPGREHLFGTDDLGRDVLTRIIYGARYDISLTLVTVLLAVVTGLVTGTIAGYFGGVTDTILMRFVDVMLAFPAFVLGLALVAFLGPSMRNIVLILAATRFPRYARLIRGTVLSVKRREYVEAAHMIGTPDHKIILEHILPNSIAPVIVYSTLDLGSIVTALAGLSFLGVGVQPPTPDWGLMLTSARNNLVIAPWTAIFPGLAISFAVIGFNFMGDGLRDALDPRLR